jgi:DNA mismatch repair protein MSH3
MAFTDRTLPDGSSEITFLYRLKRGLADASFGVWCARLAGLPDPLLVRAQEQADGLKRDTRERGLAALANRWSALTKAIAAGGGVLEAEKVESALSFLVV